MRIWGNINETLDSLHFIRVNLDCDHRRVWMNQTHKQTKEGGQLFMLETHSHISVYTHTCTHRNIHTLHRSWWLRCLERSVSLLGFFAADNHHRDHDDDDEGYNGEDDAEQSSRTQLWREREDGVKMSSMVKACKRTSCLTFIVVLKSCLWHT